MLAAHRRSMSLRPARHTKMRDMGQGNTGTPTGSLRYSILEKIASPEDLRTLNTVELRQLATEIRHTLISSVSQTGGHLGPNLGVVELTIGIHRVFESPKDTLLFDTGHQSYVHKLLTGRTNFSLLRQEGGLSGYPCRSESEHDVIENSHASTALSWADGISRYKELTNDDSWTIALIGDGALTGGMAWEALNNIAESESRRVMVIVNDNGRSYAPTIGGLANHLTKLRSSESYERTLAWGKRTLLSMGDPGKAAYEALHGMKTGIKDALLPQAMFEDLGIKYLGPVDGHDITEVEDILNRAKSLNEPVIVHVMTQKGRGYTPAEEDIADRFHAVGQIHPETGLPIAPQRFGWTAVFADEILKLAHENPTIIGLTAAMLLPVGLGPLQEAYPERVIDVGIAEQHAVTAAAGLAYAGAHPVFAVYATFLNRAFDQVLMDVALHKAGVTFILDRAGLTGDDGASHNGMWDIAMLNMIPGLQLNAPRDEETLRTALREAVNINDAPTVLRYRKGEMPAPIPAIDTLGQVDILSGSASTTPHEDEILIVATGATIPDALDAATALREKGHAVTVADPRWILPISPDLAHYAVRYRNIVTLEDGLVNGGFGWALRDALASEPSRILTLGIPKEFLTHASRETLKQHLRLDAAGIIHSIENWIA